MVAPPSSNAVTGHNCATHGQNMPDACICRGARYWMDRALAAEKRLAKYERRYPCGHVVGSGEFCAECY